MFKTRITEMLGIKYPIIQGGMMWISRAELVAAVSNAGGLGILSGFMFEDPKDLAQEIKKTKDLTDKPFGVNVTLIPTLRPAGEIDAYFDVIFDAEVKILETAGRNPEPFMDRFKAVGAKVIHKCTTVRFARKAQEVGCDAVTIDGFECAGYVGEEDIGSIILVPVTVDAVDIPVIACGGFGDARGLVAALALGAEGVIMGTRFMATKESPTHPNVKEWLTRATERDTMLVQRSLRNTARLVRNPQAEKILELERNGATTEELAPLMTGRKAGEIHETGDLVGGVLSAGEVVGLIHSIPSVSELIEGIMHDAEEIVNGLHQRGLFRRFRPSLCE